MKSLKLDHDLALAVLSGEKNSTIRLFDDKDLTVGDVVQLIDKVDPENRNSWTLLGIATLTEVIEKPLGDITDADLTGRQLYASTTTMLTDFRRYYGEGVSDEAVAKIISFNFQSQPSVEPMGLAPTLPTHAEVKLFTDGGSRGNPGPSASGYVILDMNDDLIEKAGVYLGITTNNQAEYQALKLGLEEARKIGAREVHVHMDSMLVINQMKGIFKIKNRDLWPIHEAIKELVGGFRAVHFQHVPRELNRLADQEVNDILDATVGKKEKFRRDGV